MKRFGTPVVLLVWAALSGPAWRGEEAHGTGSSFGRPGWAGGTLLSGSGPAESMAMLAAGDPVRAGIDRAVEAVLGLPRDALRDLRELLSREPVLTLGR